MLQDLDSSTVLKSIINFFVILMNDRYNKSCKHCHCYTFYFTVFGRSLGFVFQDVVPPLFIRGGWGRRFSYRVHSAGDEGNWQAVVVWDASYVFWQLLA